MKTVIPIATLIFASYINHILSLYVTKVNISENKIPLTDIVHDHFDKVDTIYSSIAYYIHIVNFLYFALFYCRNKLDLYYRVSYFIAYIATLRFITILFTYYPNARECKDPRFGHYCGDMMFSGHTAIIIITYLAYNDYNKSITKMKRMLHILVALISIFLLVVTRMHYTNDVLISSYITYISWRFFCLKFPITNIKM